MFAAKSNSEMYVVQYLVSSIEFQKKWFLRSHLLGLPMKSGPYVQLPAEFHPRILPITIGTRPKIKLGLHLNILEDECKSGCWMGVFIRSS
jgi:hypothetical protein